MNKRIVFCLLIILLLLGPLLAVPALSQSGTATLVTKNDQLFPVDRVSIYMDDTYLGNTDNAGKIVLDSFQPGPHDITAIKDGYVNTTVTANLTAGSNIDIKMESLASAAKKDYVSIIVIENTAANSKVSGAEVFVDNMSVGKTGTLATVQVNLSPGLHVITVSKPDSDVVNNTTAIETVPGGRYTILMSLNGKKFSILDLGLFTLSLQRIVFYGLVNTLQLSLVAFGSGIVIGLVMGIGRTSHNFIVRAIASVYVEGVRGLPLLLQLLFVFFGLPFLIADYTGGSFNIDIFTAAVIALSINSGAYMAEIFKAGIEAVHKGQTEAARSLGMSQGQAMRYIILPQAFKIVLPALGNEFIALIKDSSIAMVISYTEIIYWAKAIGVEHYNTFTPLLAAGIVYLLITIPLGKVVQYMEKKYSVNARSGNLPGKKKKMPRPEVPV